MIKLQSFFCFGQSTLLTLRNIQIVKSLTKQQSSTDDREAFTSKNVSVKFMYSERNKKVELPLFRGGSYKEFLYFAQDFQD